ncbi:MAG: hypothetical protein H6745_17060 [Deltaproteobacteria bacterium]|nr:hypothetical protein [Deltaproteobacteria bacterium]
MRRGGFGARSRGVGAVLLAAALLAPASAQDGGESENLDFPQIKINFVDTAEAPKIRVYFSILGPSLRSALEDELKEVTVFQKPDKAKEEELFTIADGEVAWPKGLSEEEVAQKNEAPPELLPAIDAERGAAIVVVVPGFQDEEYGPGRPLGDRSRNGAGLFFKKLGKANEMNVVWYNDDIWTYVYTAGRTTRLTKLSSQLEACARWKRIQDERFGVPPEEGEEEGEGPAKDQAECGLTSKYDELADVIKRQPYVGFWPQLFGIKPRICVDVKEGERPAWESRGISVKDADSASKPLSNPNSLTAIDVALEMLAKGGKPGQPKILILTGDGRDGYVNRFDDCRTKQIMECGDREDDKKKVTACADAEMLKIRAADQAQFAARLERWIGFAKAAGIRIYSVVHPTAQKYQADRLAVLAWRTGGTARVAEDAEGVIAQYEDLIAELNNQFVVTFVDDAAKPDAELQYMVGAKVGSRKLTTPPFKAQVPSLVERPFISNVQAMGEEKLGKGGFLAVVIVVALLVLVIVVKLVGKLFKSGEGVAKKAAKGDDKAKAKLKEKAKKEAEKRAKAKAKAKEKMKKKMKG